MHQHLCVLWLSMLLRFFYSFFRFLLCTAQKEYSNDNERHTRNFFILWRVFNFYILAFLKTKFCACSAKIGVSILNSDLADLAACCNKVLCICYTPKINSILLKQCPCFWSVYAGWCGLFAFRCYGWYLSLEKLLCFLSFSSSHNIVLRPFCAKPNIWSASN